MEYMECMKYMEYMEYMHLFCTHYINACKI
jgi:hypothetical protein